ncbi:MAG: hypothetical protein WC699_02450 [Bacteroidales bacterium]|jgi:hypothetical protein
MLQNQEKNACKLGLTWVYTHFFMLENAGVGLVGNIAQNTTSGGSC